MTTVSFRLVGAPMALAGQGCPEAVEPLAPSFAGTAPSVVRMTYRYSNGGALICDSVLSLSGGNPVLALPDTDPPMGLVDIHAEYFRDAGGTFRLAGKGRYLKADLRTPGPFDLRITPRDEFSCAAGRGAMARAFHAAVLLPNGEVLVTGGAVADPTGASGTVDFVNTKGALFATAAVEIYDPQTGISRPIAVPGLTPRLMHRAYVLDEAPGEPMRIALYGGFTVIGDPNVNPALSVGGTFRLSPTAEAVGAPVEIIEYDLATATLSRVTDPASGGTADVMGAVMSGADIANGATPVTAGGWLDGTEATNRLTFDTFETASGSARGNAALRAPRLGATVTDINGTTALVWGGGMQPSMDTATQAGELLVALGGGVPGSNTMTLAGSSAAMRAWHTASRAGDDSVIVAGGFLITGGTALEPQPVFVQRLTVGQNTTVSDVALTGGTATPAGYLESITVPEGNVLISGGNPGTGIGGCPMMASGLVCSLDNAYLFRTSTGQLEQANPLGVSRYGHRMTALPDGTVLVTGGLHGEASTLRVLADNEIYDPRTELDDPIADLAPMIQRVPGDIARDGGGDPASECIVIETSEPAP